MPVPAGPAARTALSEPVPDSVSRTVATLFVRLWSSESFACTVMALVLVPSAFRVVGTAVMVVREAAATGVTVTRVPLVAVPDVAVMVAEPRGRRPSPRPSRDPR